MTYRGRVTENGLIALEPGVSLPEGSEVEVSLVPKEDDEASTWGEVFKDIIGKAEGFPSDASVNHDHYIYDTPERFNEAFKELVAEVFDKVLKTLTYREREILKLRYGIGGGYTFTLEQVGMMFRVTRERVRQIEAKAISKLQHPVRACKLVKGLLDAWKKVEASGPRGPRRPVVDQRVP